MADFSEAINFCSEEFDKACQMRYDKVAHDEGILTFLDKDVISQYMEAMADCAVIARKQYIKLMLLQHHFEEEISDNLTLGTDTFKGDL